MLGGLGSLRAEPPASAADGNGWLQAAAASLCGLRAFNEDAHLLQCGWSPAPEGGCEGGAAALFAVADGHGGSTVANFVVKNLGAELRTELDACKWSSAEARKTAAECAFLALDRSLPRGVGRMSATCGSCCVAVAVLDGAQPAEGVSAATSSSRPRTRSRSRSPAGAEEASRYRVLFMNLGDSRALLCRRGAGVVAETTDHKPEDPVERQRIEAADGFVTAASAAGPARVDGVLSVSRAFGDFRWKCNSTVAPERQKVSPLPTVSEFSAEAGDILVLACDGVFDVLKNGDVADVVLEALDGHRAAAEKDAESPGAKAPARATAGPKCATEAVVREALARGTCDNVTCVVVEIVGGGPAAGLASSAAAEG